MARFRGNEGFASLKQVETNPSWPLPLQTASLRRSHRRQAQTEQRLLSRAPRLPLNPAPSPRCKRSAASASSFNKTLHATRTRCLMNHLQRGGFFFNKKKNKIYIPCNTYKTNKQTKPSMSSAHHVITCYLALIKYCLSGENPSHLVPCYDMGCNKLAGVFKKHHLPKLIRVTSFICGPSQRVVVKARKRQKWQHEYFANLE